jgi:hypothetical protein
MLFVRIGVTAAGTTANFSFSEFGWRRENKMKCIILNKEGNI